MSTPATPRSEHNGEPTEPSRRDGDSRRRSTTTTARRRRRGAPALKRTLLLLCCCFLLTVTTCRAQTTSTASRQRKAECPAQELILPCRCLTRGDEYQIWCSHSELPLVLDGLKLIGQHVAAPIDELILENNNLPSLPGGFFLSLRILRLMLRNNNLERVTSGWLTGLENSLMELYVVEPDLRSVPIDSLEHLNRLEAVTIKSGAMKRGPYFSHLPRLRYVQLESPSLVELSPRNFKHLPALEKVHVTGSARLTRLEANLFVDLPRLDVINVSHCAVDWVHPRAMSLLPSLAELHLVGNRISDAGMVGRATRDLPALSVLNLDANVVERLAEASFVDMPTLRELRVARNRITEIDHGAFHRTPMLRTLNLNRNAIRRVHPESFLQHSGDGGLEELWLVDNDLSDASELRALLDALPRLTFLELSRNYLEDIPFGALRGHGTLERLHLDHNRLRSIGREAFTAMPALRELRMRNNSLSNHLLGPLWNLPGLKGLDLSHNYFERLDPPLLANLPSLRRIDLSENRLSVVDPASFLGTPALEHVNLSHNALSSLHPATFRTLTKLYELDVDRNRLVEFVPGLPRGVEYLRMSGNRITALPLPPSPDLDLPSLRMLDVSSNGIYRVPPGSLRSLPHLRRLDVGENALQQLEDGCVDGLSRLEALDVRHNRLMIVHVESLRDARSLVELNLRGNRIAALHSDVLRHVPRLERLDVSRNLLSDIAPGTFRTTRELRRLDASHNALSQLPISVRGLQLLERLDLTDNRLRDLHPDTLNTLASLSDLRVSRNRIAELPEGAFERLPRLIELDLSDNDLENVRPHAVRGLSSLKAIRLGKNRIRTLNGRALSDLPALESLELQENRLSSIAENAFDAVPRLLLLNLSRNSLSGLDAAGLRNVRSLEVLDLSHNRISRVDSAALSTMEWLVELNMDGNRICTILGAPFNGMPRLRVLSLRNNRMTSLPERAVERLRTNIAVLELDGNPLACSCSMMWMRAWLQEASETGPRCADGSLLREMRLTREECSTRGARLQIGGEPASPPGCETEPIEADAYGTSQVFAPPWQSGSAMQQQQQQQTHGGIGGMAPSPEESDYFYDEYVDYPYNESSILAAEHNNSLINNGLTPPEVNRPVHHHHQSTSQPPGDRLSSHFVAGDTPTLYAEPKKNSSSSTDKQGAANTLDNTGVAVHSSPSTSGFTFFGVPLPALNLGTLWGSGRNADRKSAIVRTRGTGRVVHPFPPTDPDVQRGGFVPMLPGSGGFRPIVDPATLSPNRRYNYTFGSERTASTNRTDWPSETVVHHSRNVFRQNGSDVVADPASFTKRGPSLSPTTAGPMPSPPSTTLPPIPSAAPATVVPSSSVGPKSKQQHVKDESKFGPVHKANIEKVKVPQASAAKTSTERIKSDNGKVPTTSPTPPSNGTRYFENPFVSDTSPSSTSTRGRFDSETSDDDDDDAPIGSSRSTSAPRKPTASPAPWELSTNYFTMTTSTVPAITFGTVVTTSQTPENVTGVAQSPPPSRNSLSPPASSSARHRDKVKGENTPSSLSALLVPGGQQPQFRPSIGRPTITKVNSPHAEGDSDDRGSSSPSTSTSTERSSLDEILTEGGRPFVEDGPDAAVTAAAASPPVHDNTMSWYFKNYNASDLEPYVGPGADSQAPPQHVSSSSSDTSPASLCVALLVSIAVHAATPSW